MRAPCLILLWTLKEVLGMGCKVSITVAQRLHLLKTLHLGRLGSVNEVLHKSKAGCSLGLASFQVRGYIFTGETKVNVEMVVRFLGKLFLNYQIFAFFE